jgi:hypothetical protein
VRGGERRLKPDKTKGVRVLFDCPSHSLPLTSHCDYAVKLLPHPHPPVALGLLKVNPEPCIELT